VAIGTGDVFIAKVATLGTTFGSGAAAGRLAAGGGALAADGAAFFTVADEDWLGTEASTCAADSDAGLSFDGLCVASISVDGGVWGEATGARSSAPTTLTRAGNVGLGDEASDAGILTFFCVLDAAAPDGVLATAFAGAVLSTVAREEPALFAEAGGSRTGVAETAGAESG